MSISILRVLLEGYFNWPLESLKSDKKLASYGIFMPPSRFTDVIEEQFAILIFQFCGPAFFDHASLLDGRGSLFFFFFLKTI